MTGYRIKGIPLSNLYRSGTSSAITSENNNNYKGLGTNFSAFTLAIEKPFPITNYFKSPNVYLNFNALMSDFPASNPFSFSSPSNGIYFFKHANFIIIGGGGGGGAGGGGSKDPGNGNRGNGGGVGGHGEFRVITCYPLSGVSTINVTVGDGGPGGVGVSKDKGGTGGKGGTSSIVFSPTETFSSDGGEGGTGGSFAGTPTHPSPGESGKTPSINYSFMKFTIYNHVDSNPIKINPLPPDTIGVNDTTNFYARDTQSPGTSNIYSGSGGSPGRGNTNPGEIPGTGKSFGENGTKGYSGRVVIYWLYNPD